MLFRRYNVGKILTRLGTTTVNIMPNEVSESEFVARDKTDSLPMERDDPKSSKSPKRRIRTFAVLDLETSNLPDYNFYRVGITELSIYGFNADELEKEMTDRADGKALPPQPRILHKLTLLFNPLMRIDLGAERVTGLNNEMLETESKFNENAYGILDGFLKHLQGPVCLVAHNGYRFDFPIIKHVLDKISKKLANDLLCLDSYMALPDIDEIRKNSHIAAKTSEVAEIIDLTEDVDNSMPATATVEKGEMPIDHWKFNETTPKHCRTHPYNGRARKHSATASPTTPTHAASPTIERKFNFRRSLFASPASGGKFQRRYIPKNVYRLGNIYERAFGQSPGVAHHAEADVDVLMKVMQYYGKDFLSYAEENAVPFDEVPKLGMSS